MVITPAPAALCTPGGQTIAKRTFQGQTGPAPCRYRAWLHLPIPGFSLSAVPEGLISPATRHSVVLMMDSVLNLNTTFSRNLEPPALH